MSSRSLEYWRDYFKGVSSHLFDIIDGAIMVAAADYPEQFSLRRCTIAERLSPPCLAVSDDVEKVEASKIKEIKVVNKSYDDEHAEMMNVENHNIRDAEAEALNDQIEHESQCLMEVLRIRDILFDHREQSHSELHEALRRLQLMNLTLDLLQETEIGKAVNLLRKHQSKDISELARILIEDWKNDVDGWLKVDTPIADSENPPLDDEEAGLPSPPMDEGALFLYPPVSMEPSKFFDGLDDDGNPVQREEVTRNIKDTKIVQKMKNKASNEAKMVAKENQIEPKKKNKVVMVVRLNKPLIADNIEPEMMQKSVLKGAIQMKPQVGQSNKLKLDDDALEEKFEASKKKLQDHYQNAKSAKRQRTAQYVEFDDLPKQAKRQRAAQCVEFDDLPKQARRRRAAQYVEFDDLPKQGPGCQIPPAKPKNRKRSGGAGRRFIQE